MGTRARNPETQQRLTVREIVEPLTADLGSVNAQAARLEAIARRNGISDEESRDLLFHAGLASATLRRVEEQLEVALASQPREIAEHSRVQDLRAAIGAIRARLGQLGG